MISNSCCLDGAQALSHQAVAPELRVPIYHFYTSKLSLVKTGLCEPTVWPYLTETADWPRHFLNYWPFSLASSASINFEPHLFLRCNILVWVFFLFPFHFLFSVPEYSLLIRINFLFCRFILYIKNIIKVYYFYLCVFYKGYFVFALFKKVSFKNSTSEDKVLKGPPFTFDSLAPEMMSERQKKKN